MYVTEVVPGGDGGGDVRHRGTGRERAGRHTAMYVTGVLGPPGPGEAHTAMYVTGARAHDGRDAAPGRHTAMYVTGGPPGTASARPSFTSRRRCDSASDTAMDREPCGI